MSTDTKATSLFSLSTLKQYLKIDSDNTEYDERLVIIGDGISERAERIAGRLFVSRQLTQLLDGSGRYDLWLHHYPVKSVSSLRFRYSLLGEWIVVDVATQLAIDLDLGILYLKELSFPKGPLRVELTHVVGFDEKDGDGLPADVVQASLDYTKLVYNRWDSGGVMASSISIGPQSVSVVLDVPRDIVQVFERYRPKRIPGVS